MTAMRKPVLAGVLYAEDFDEPDRDDRRMVASPVPQAPVQPPPIRVEPTFSLVELQHAVEQALEEGQNLERSKAGQDDARRRADALARLAASLERSEAQVVEDRACFATALAATVMGAVTALLPELNARHGVQEVALLCRRLLPTLFGERRLVIRVQPASVSGLRNELSPLLREHATEVEWVADAAMGPADLSVRWEHGAVTRNADALLREIVALIMPDTDTNADAGEA